MDTLLELLQKIKERPELYLGKPSLERLKAFMDGYITHQQEIYENYYPPFLSGFQEYIDQLYGLNTDHGWSEIIQFFCIREDVAFFKFYELLDNFLEDTSK